MKKTIAFLLTVVTVLSLFTMGASARETVAQVQAKVDALKLLPSVESYPSEGYEQALAQTKDAVYALAYLTEQEMKQVTGYQDAIQLYIDLIVLKAKGLLSLEPVTATDYWEKTTALEQVNELLFEQEPVYLLAEYTKDTVNSAFYPPETKTGFVSLYEIQLKYHQAEKLRADYLATLTDQQRYELKQEEYRRVLASFPDTFTQENVLTYAKDFVMLIEEVEVFGGKYSFINTHFADERERYEQLREDFEVVMGIYCGYFMEEIDREILSLCDVKKASGYSQLQLQLIERPVYDTLATQIQCLSYINGARLENNMENLDVFDAYKQVFYPAAYMYGDLNGDCQINASDALTALRVAVEKEQLNDARYAVGDLDGNGAVNAKDALLILQYTVGKIQFFPVEMEVYGILV